MCRSHLIRSLKSMMPGEFRSFSILIQNIVLFGGRGGGASMYLTSLSLSLSLSHPLSLSHSLALYHIHTHPLSLSLSLTYTHTLSLSRSLSHTHTHSLSLSLFNCFRALVATRISDFVRIFESNAQGDAADHFERMSFREFFGMLKG